jgi:hypothetical protein
MPPFASCGHSVANAYGRLVHKSGCEQVQDANHEQIAGLAMPASFMESIV